MVRLASTQSPEIHRRYGTTASFLDVNTAVEPWKNIDHRASTSQSAQFKQYADNARELWQYLRNTHGGPVFGEGLAHWYWSGLLDGVEAQFGVGWPWGLGPDAPLLVDFDLIAVNIGNCLNQTPGFGCQYDFGLVVCQSIDRFGHFNYCIKLQNRR